MAIVVAFVIRSVPAGQRTAVGALTQLHPQIEQASTDLGANSLQTFRWVTLPLIKPALLTGLSYSFARSMTSVSTIVLLVTPETKIITSQVLSAAQHRPVRGGIRLLHGADRARPGRLRDHPTARRRGRRTAPHRQV